MSGGDGTGPMGMGPMTGGGRGFCAVPMKDWRGSSIERGFDRGRGRGWRNCYWKTGLPGWMRADQGVIQDDLSVLEDQQEYLKQQLASIQDRMATLKKPLGDVEK